MHRQLTTRQVVRHHPARHHRARRARLPGWALALAIVAAGALLAWLHVIVLFGG
jgi:ferric-dicitrate binding protein FerR (iron transport regulator)